MAKAKGKKFPKAVTWKQWLESVASSSSGAYSHLLLVEKASLRPRIINSLTRYVSQAHDDGRKRMREPFEQTLNPLRRKSTVDPAKGYPENLPETTQMGYFGEILAGLIAEEFGLLSESWTVPGYLFRFHNEAFHALERARQSGSVVGDIIGRTGDDCIAFKRTASGIEKALVCEAKCYERHDSNAIREAHIKASEVATTPIGLDELIQVLLRSDRPDASQWIDDLTQLRFSPLPRYQRNDCVVYVCGQKPVKKKSWMPRRAPHVAYSGGRTLAAVEVHLGSPRSMVRSVYKGVSRYAQPWI